MSDTIELLETIGRDALLRRASREDLTQALDGLNASEGLRMAAASGDRSHLVGELGEKSNTPTQVNQNPGQGGCDPYEDDEENKPDHQDDTDDESAAI